MTHSNGSAARFILPVFLVIALVAVAGYFIAHRGTSDKSLIAQAVQSLTDRYGKTADGEPVFSYDDIAITHEQGQWQTVLMNPQWIVEMPEMQRIVFKTPLAVLKPTSVLFDTFKAELPQPVTVERGGEAWLRVSFPQPLKADWQKVQQNDLTLYQAVVDLPDSAQIERLIKPKSFTFTHGGEEVVRILSGARFADFAEVSAMLKQVTFKADAGGETLSADTLNVEYGWQQRTPQPSPVKWNLEVTNFLNSVEGSMPYGALNVKVTGNYHGNLPQSLNSFSWAEDVRSFDLSALEVQADDFALMAYGQFEKQGNELLPVGQGNVQVTNLPALREALAGYGLVLDAKDEKLADLLLRASVGQSLATAQEVELPVSRTEGGSLHIGQASFEELMAVVLTGGKLMPKHQSQE
jgi:hypothetical protein